MGRHLTLGDVIDAVGTVDPATQQRRRLRLASTLASLYVRTALVPETAVRRRQRIQICGAARILTALGVRVQVISSRTPWPTARPGRLVVSDDVGWLGGLALVTSVPRTTTGWRAICGQVLPGAPAEADPGDREDVLCPVVVRYRTDAGPLEHAPAALAEMVAASGLVIEVHLLPAIDASSGSLRPLEPVA
jgi:hypothetical protein